MASLLRYHYVLSIVKKLSKGGVSMKKSESPPTLFIDPVCFMKVVPHKDLMFTYQLRTYYFCAEACRKAFETNPEQYLDPNSPGRKSWWGRYLVRLNRATKGKPLNCH